MGLGLEGDAGFMDRFTRLRLDVTDLASLYGRFVERLKRGESLGPEVSMLKLWATETFGRISDLLIESAGAAGAMPGDVLIDDAVGVDVLTSLYNARPATIYGGSSEIQRNILAAQVLRLPG